MVHPSSVPKPCLLSVALLLLLSRADTAEAGQGAAPSRVTRLEVAFSPRSAPFDELRQVWLLRDGVWTSTRTVRWSSGLGDRSEVRTMTDEEVASAVRAFEGCATLDRSPRGAPPGSFEVRRDDEPGWQGAADSAAGTCISQALKASQVGWPLPRLSGIYWRAGEFGELRLSSDLTAYVWVDGRSTGRVTPLVDLRLEPGVHEIALQPLSGGAPHRESVQIQAGQVLSLAVSIGETGAGGVR
jgi:hypothetical protein